MLKISLFVNVTSFLVKNLGNEIMNVRLQGNWSAAVLFWL
uniref:Uncharacterized protein n=1 Tax=Anguilla anguilla TaxID=7936 RepID=A0A0E9W8W9_ANGAN